MEYRIYSVPNSTSQKNACTVFDNNRYSRDRHGQISVLLLRVPEIFIVALESSCVRLVRNRPRFILIALPVNIWLNLALIRAILGKGNLNSLEILNALM